MITKDDILATIQTIPDPELGISLVDLGLIYEVTIRDGGIVHVLMTLTTIGCPLFSLIETPIKQKVGELDGVKSVEVELTFDPPWDVAKISEEAKMQLGMI